MNARHFSLFFWGLLFAIGLGVSGMTQPSKVVGFLDFVGNWDPSLAMVMAGAVSTYLVLSRFVLKSEKPVLEERFALPTRLDLDGRLIAGSALFGVGWGMAGFCPGPALVSLTTFNPSVFIFILSMSTGMYVYGALDTRYSREPDGGAGAMEAAAAAAKSR